jgi:hypothetical protein
MYCALRDTAKYNPNLGLCCGKGMTKRLQHLFHALMYFSFDAATTGTCGIGRKILHDVMKKSILHHICREYFCKCRIISHENYILVHKIVLLGCNLDTGGR